MDKEDTPQLIYVKEGEEIAQILDKITENKSPVIYLIVPDESLPFRNLLNLKLLKQEADDSKKSVVIVSQDLLIERLSKRAGFEVREDLPPHLEEYRPEVRVESGKGDSRGLGRGRARGMRDIIPPRAEKESVSLPLSLEIPEESLEISEEKETEEEPEEVPEKAEPKGLKGEPEMITEPVRTGRKFAMAEKREVISKLSGLLKKIFPRRFSPFGIFNKILLIFIGLALVIGGLVAYLVLPKTKVTITPRKEMLSFDLESEAVSAISKIDFSENKIPAQLIHVEKTASKDFLSSGEELRKERAKGIITVYNEYSSNPQTLIERTRFVSQDGKIFRTIKTIVVPGATIGEGEIVASSIDAEVEAAEPGESYNIGPSTFSIPGFKGTPKFRGFYGESKAPMSGGFEGEVKVVTAEDLQRAKEAFTSELVTLANEEFRSKTPEGLTLLDEARFEEVFEVSADKGEGEAAERFKVEGKARIAAVLFKEGDVKELIENALTKRLPDDKVTVPESQKITFSTSDIDFDKGTMDLSLHVEELVVWQVPAEEIRDNLAGKSEDDVRRYLSSQPQIENAEITFWPFWVKRVPVTKDKIKIEIKS